MSLKGRDWDAFPNIFKENFKGMTAFLTFVGFVIAIISLQFKDDTIISIIFWSGIILTFGSIIWVFQQSFPPNLICLDDYKDKNIPLDILTKIKPIPFKIGVIGCSKSGKTTFLRKCNFRSPPLARTNDIYATNLQLPENKGNVVVLDGDGKQHTQQFVIIEKADLLIIFFDHNETDDKNQVVKKRLSEHEEFFEQIIFHLKSQKNIKYIHIIMNKNDLWQKSISKEKLETWFNEQITKLSNNGNYKLTSSFEHSNNKSEKIGEVIDIIYQSKEKFNEK
jgi:GTPase SAR1 family protein